MVSHFYDSTYSSKCSVAKTRLTLVFKLHLRLLVHSTKTVSFSNVQHSPSQPKTNHCFQKERAPVQCCM